MVDACDNPDSATLPSPCMIQGINEFFIVSESKVRHIGLQCCLIALTRARWVLVSW
jgi:hypothetical protein